MKILKTILLCLSGFFISGHAKTFSEESTVSLINTTTENKISQAKMYMQANFFQKSGDFSRAFKTYNQLQSKDPSPHATTGYMRLLYDTNQHLALIHLLDKNKELKNLVEKDTELEIMHAQSLLNTNRHQEAESILLKLHENDPTNVEVAYYLATSRAIMQKLKHAVETIDKSVKTATNRRKIFLLHFLKALHTLLKSHRTF